MVIEIDVTHTRSLTSSLSHSLSQWRFWSSSFAHALDSSTLSLTHSRNSLTTQHENHERVGFSVREGRLFSFCCGRVFFLFFCCASVSVVVLFFYFLSRRNELSRPSIVVVRRSSGRWRFLVFFCLSSPYFSFVFC